MHIFDAYLKKKKNSLVLFTPTCCCCIEKTKFKVDLNDGTPQKKKLLKFSYKWHRKRSSPFPLGIRVGQEARVDQDFLHCP